MKRFLDKTWAKVAAFILFFVFLGLSIAGGVGIYFLAANDVYLAGSEASRQILYDGQASDVMTTVIDGLYNCSDNEALRDWLLERCPPENGYGITVTNTATGEEFSTALPKDAKIIYTANLTLETRDYDTARAALDAALSDADGYMESSSEYTNTDSTRSVSLTLRVPQDSYKSFLAAAAQSGSVTYQNQQAEDITTRYMDTEARLASLTAQRTRLQELQAQADTLADLLEIESSLSDVQYQIESWQSQLDWYSNQVSCCTVYITLNEVETLTPTSTSFGAKLLAALRNGWTGFVSGAQAVAVFLVGAWPAILIGAVCGVIYYRVRHPRKKK